MPCAHTGRPKNRPHALAEGVAAPRAQEIEKDAEKFQTNWDDEKKTFVLQLFFKL